MSAGYFPKREKIGLEDLFHGLVTACHILDAHSLFDAYGHISVRSPDNPATFWMPCNMAPALVRSPDDLVEYHVESAEPVEKDARPGFRERFIHSEIYKKFPGVNSVVHSHAGEVLPYCVSGVPLRNGIHMAGYLGMICFFSYYPSFPISPRSDWLVGWLSLCAHKSSSINIANHLPLAKTNRLKSAGLGRLKQLSLRLETQSSRGKHHAGRFARSRFQARYVDGLHLLQSALSAALAARRQRVVRTQDGTRSCRRADAGPWLRYRRARHRGGRLSSHLHARGGKGANSRYDVVECARRLCARG